MATEYRLDTPEAFEQMREDTEFNEGAMSFITYGGVILQAYINREKPRYYGIVARIGDVVTKDENGVFYVNGKSTR